MLSKAFLNVFLSWFGRPLVTLLTVLFFYFLLPQSFWWQYWLMYSIIIVSINYKQLTMLKTFKQLSFLGIILFLFHYINKVVIWGTVALILLLLIYRIVRDVKKDKEGKSLFMEGIRNIETRLFGKSLDRKNWRKK